MAAVVKSWIKALCPKCRARRVFLLQTDWVLVCSECGSEKRLEQNGLLAGV